MKGHRFLFFFYALLILHYNNLQAKQIELEWQNIEGAKGYEVDLSGREELIESTSNKIKVDVESGDYTYRVRALDNLGRAGEWSPKQNLTVTPAAPPKIEIDESQVYQVDDSKSLNLEWKNEKQKDLKTKYVLKKDSRIIRDEVLDAPKLELKDIESGTYTLELKSAYKSKKKGWVYGPAKSITLKIKGKDSNFFELRKKDPFEFELLAGVGDGNYDYQNHSDNRQSHLSKPFYNYTSTTRYWLLKRLAAQVHTRGASMRKIENQKTYHNLNVGLASTLLLGQPTSRRTYPLHFELSYGLQEYMERRPLYQNQNWPDSFSTEKIQMWGPSLVLHFESGNYTGFNFGALLRYFAPIKSQFKGAQIEIQGPESFQNFRLELEGAYYFGPHFGLKLVPFAETQKVKFRLVPPHPYSGSNEEIKTMGFSQRGVLFGFVLRL